MTTDDPIPLFSAALVKVLAGVVDPARTAFLDMVADDVVMEFPFAPASGVGSVRTRVALRPYLERVAAMVEIEGVDVEHVHVAGDVVVAEFRASGRGRRHGTPYQQRYISVIETAGGRITRYRDYWNPLVFEELGRREAEA